MIRILTASAAKRWSLSVALMAGLAMMIVALSPSADAQGSDLPTPPHWFWGNDASAYVGATVEAVDANGTVFTSSSPDESAHIVDSTGGWSVQISQDQASRVKLRLTHGNVVRETAFFDVLKGGFSVAGISITQFMIVDDELVDDSDTITVRIIARRAPDGRIEFGMRDQNGEEIFPRARFFPNGGPGHSRWLSSSLIDFGGGFEGKIIARYEEGRGRTEFGFRVVGYDELFPRARFFPATGPDHNRWLTSSPIDIAKPR